MSSRAWARPSARLVEELKRASDDEVRMRLEAAIRQIDEGA